MYMYVLHVSRHTLEDRSHLEEPAEVGDEQQLCVAGFASEVQGDRSVEEEEQAQHGVVVREFGRGAVHHAQVLDHPRHGEHGATCADGAREAAVQGQLRRGLQGNKIAYIKQACK